MSRIVDYLNMLDDNSFRHEGSSIDNLRDIYDSISESVHAEKVDKQLNEMFKSHASRAEIRNYLMEELTAQSGTAIADDDCGDLADAYLTENCHDAYDDWHDDEEQERKVINEALETTSQKIEDNADKQQASTPENKKPASATGDGQIARYLKKQVQTRFDREKHPTDKSAEIDNDGYGFTIVRANGKKLIYDVHDGFRVESLHKVQEGFFDDERELESRAYGEDKDTIFSCYQFYMDTYDRIMEGSNADLMDNLKNIFTENGGQCRCYNVRPDSFTADGWLPSDAYKDGKWTWYHTWILKYLRMDANMTAEDLTMWYYRTKLNGKKIPNTPALFHVIDLFKKGQINWESTEEKLVEENLTESSFSIGNANPNRGHDCLADEFADPVKDGFTNDPNVVITDNWMPKEYNDVCDQYLWVGYRGRNPRKKDIMRRVANQIAEYLEDRIPGDDPEVYGAETWVTDYTADTGMYFVGRTLV